jgi:GH18 family chitinase
MAKSFEDSEQRLSQISVELLNRMSEIQKLRLAVQSAEASKGRTMNLTFALSAESSSALYHSTAD